MKLTCIQVLGAVVCLGIVLVASEFDYQDSLVAQSAYCENVELWESSALPKVERPGHPDYADINC